MKSLFFNIVLLNSCLTAGAQYVNNQYGRHLGMGGMFNYTIFEDTIQQGYYKAYPLIPNPKDIVAFNCVSISDSLTGDLLMMVQGDGVFNANGQLIDNSDNMMTPHADSFLYIWGGAANEDRQRMIVLPKAAKKFDIFMPFFSDSSLKYAGLAVNGADLIYHHEVDMKLNNGKGRMTKKMEHLNLGGVHIRTNGLEAIRHANGRDWWLIKAAYSYLNPYNSGPLFSKAIDSLYYLTYLVQQDTILGPNISFITSFKGTKINEGPGYLRAAKDGSAITYSNAQEYLFVSSHFNRCDGSFSDVKKMGTPKDSLVEEYNDPSIFVYDALDGNGDIGIAYSPNGRFIYLSRWFHIWQYDTQEPDSALAWVNITRSPDTLSTYAGIYSFMHLGKDNKVYVGAESGISLVNNAVSVIDSPNNKGLACHLVKRKLKFNSSSQGSTHGYSNMPNYNLGPNESLCWPTSIADAEKSKDWKLYPNPTNGQLRIQYWGVDAQQIDVLNPAGKIVISAVYPAQTLEHIIDLSRLAKGLYFVRIDNRVKKIVIE
jgi:Secretion system C-terminal sorting domain